MQDQRGYCHVDHAGGHDVQRLFQIGYLDARSPVQPLPGELDKLRLAVQREDVGSPAGELRGEHSARAAQLQNAFAPDIAGQTQDRWAVTRPILDRFPPGTQRPNAIAWPSAAIASSSRPAQNADSFAVGA